MSELSAATALMGLTLTEAVWLIAVLMVVSALAGFAAGLFGIGGGMVIVPALFYAFGSLDVSDEARMHAAVATSLATIVVTSLRSARAHYQRGSFDRDTAMAWAPWIIGGSFLGALTAPLIPGRVLVALFGVIALVVALRMVVSARKTQSSGAMLKRNGAVTAGAGGGLGFLSAWLGIGGGVFGVALLSWRGLPIHRAVGTAAAFGAMIGAPGALGFMLAGLGAEGRLPLSIGYVNAPAFLSVVVVTTFTAPLGASFAHHMSEKLLKRVFAALLAVVSLRMISESVLTAYAAAQGPVTFAG